MLEHGRLDERNVLADAQLILGQPVDELGVALKVVGAVERFARATEKIDE